jgi:hypothetical protein
MNPDAAQAVPELAESGLVPPAAAPLLSRVARGELLSVHGELRAMLYAAVLLITGGAGVLVKENLDRIGPVVIAAALGLAALAALVWVVRGAPQFSWREVPSPNLAFDYVLLLGVLLGAADLAYIEVKFTPLGAEWPWHLLIVSLLTGFAAFRFDSRVVFSLALSTFAAWRGISAGRLGSILWAHAGSVRWNAVGCGVLFAVLGAVLLRTRRKAHFEPAAVHLGWLLILGGLASGMAESGRTGYAWSSALLVTGGGLAIASYRSHRFSLFAFGLLAAYGALSRLVIEAIEGGAVEALGCFWFAITSILVVAGLLVAHRRLKEPA